MEDDTKPKNLYSVLGIHPSATQEQIRDKFKKQSMHLHPDKSGSKEGDLFNEIKEAHDVLIDEKLRDVYDDYGNMGINYIVNNYKTKNFSINEIKYMLRKKDELSKQQWIEKLVNSSGSLGVGIKCKNGYPQFKSCSLDYKTKVYDKNDCTVFLGANAETDYRKRFSGGLKVDFNKKLSNNFLLFSKSIIGKGFFTATGIKGKISKSTTGTETIMFRNNAFELHLNAMRNLYFSAFDYRCEGFMNFIFSKEKVPTLTTGIVKDNQRSLWMLALDINELLFRLIGSLSYYFSKTFKLTTDINVCPFNDHILSLSVQSTYFLNKYTAGDLSVSAGADGLSLQIGFIRWGHSFRIPIYLTPKATIENSIPLFVYSLLFGCLANLLIVVPYKRSKKEIKLSLKREVLDENRKKAIAWIENLKNTVEMQREMEEKKNGLVILHATYGHLSSRPRFKGTCYDSLSITELDSTEDDNNAFVINVTDQIQFLVENSELHLFATSKSELPGIYDPLSGYPNYLEIFYTYKRKNYHAVISDNQEFHLPKNKSSE